MVNLELDKNSVKKMILEITQFITVYVVFHLLTYTIDNTGKLFDEKTLKTLVYIVIGIIIYYIIIKRIVLQILLKKNENI